MYKITKTGKVQVWKCWVEGPEVYTRYGQVEGKKITNKYTAKATNQGRSNERNPEQQAIFECEAAYQAQYDNKHYRYSVAAAEEHVKSNRVPMKAVNFKDHSKKVNYPCVVSTKLNGSRCTIIGGDFISKAGRVEECKVPHLVEAVRLLDRDIDCEVYCHGYSLQQIRSAWLKPDVIKDTELPDGSFLTGLDSKLLEVHVFDVPVVGKTFEERLELLQEIGERVEELGIDCIKFPEMMKVNLEIDGDDWYTLVTSQGYEGVVYRNLDGLYEFGNRSYDMIKRKPRLDSEGLVLDVTEDKSGQGVLLLRTNDDMGKVTFKCKMKGTAETRAYKEQRKLIGRWVTYEYEELSDKGVPTKPSGICPRLCNTTGEPYE